MRPHIFVTTALLVLLLILSAERAGSTLPNIQKAEQLAQVGQHHQIALALELYHLEHGQYPNVSDDRLISTLYTSGYLEAEQLAGEVRYDRSAPDKYSLRLE